MHIHHVKQRPGVLTELVLAFVSKGFGTNTYSRCKKWKTIVYKRLALDVQSISVSSLSHGNQYFY